ncbi:MAG: hypothetical protein MK207_03205 [Saprospiraceae bacterium]|nr:hypothetical protein [Saprospiraceae bacterium]
MSEVKKNYIGAVIFILFVVGLPLLTVYFSKSGLDKYKEMRSEMEFLNDSIRIDFNNNSTYWNAELNNEYLQGKLILVSFCDSTCQPLISDMIDSLKMVQEYFNVEDQNKMLFIIHFGDFINSSLNFLDHFLEDSRIDTSKWRFVKHLNVDSYRLGDKKLCTNIVLLDGRVSRKDHSGDYKKGPLMCAHYNLTDRDELHQLLQNMAVIMPEKQRKKIIYKEDEKLF